MVYIVDDPSAQSKGLSAGVRITLRGTVDEVRELSTEIWIRSVPARLKLRLPHNKLLLQPIEIGAEIEVVGRVSIERRNELNFLDLEQINLVVSLIPPSKQSYDLDQIMDLFVLPGDGGNRESETPEPELNKAQAHVPPLPLSYRPPCEVAPALSRPINQTPALPTGEFKASDDPKIEQFLAVNIAPLEVTAPRAPRPPQNASHPKDTPHTQTPREPAISGRGRRRGDSLQNEDIEDSQPSVTSQAAIETVEPVAELVIKEPVDPLPSPQELEQLDQAARAAARQIIEKFVDAGLISNGRTPKVTLVTGRGPGHKIHLEGEQDENKIKEVARYRQTHGSFTEPGLGTFSIRDNLDELVYIFPED